MKRHIAVTAAFLFFMTQGPFLFAQTRETQESKELAIQLAFKEEAMRSAFEDAEVINLEEKTEPAFSFLQANPYVTIATEYNDNIFAIKRDIDGDMVTALKPGVRIGFGDRANKQGFRDMNKRNRSALFVDFGTDVRYYVFNSRYNRSYPYGGVYAKLDTSRYKLNFTQAFTSTYSLKSDIIVGDKGITNYEVYATGFGLANKYKRLGWEFNYEGNYYDYSGQFRKNTYQERSFGLTGLFRPNPLPKTEFLLEYEYGFNEYTKMQTNYNDNTYYKLYAGVRGRISGKTVGHIKIGYENRVSKAPQSYNLFIYNVDLDYQYSPKTNFRLEFKHEPQQASYLTDLETKLTRVFLKCTYLLSNKFTLDSGLGYENYDYDSGRKDNLYPFNTKLSYALHDWIKVYLEYMFRARTSSDSNASYINNIYKLGAEASF